MGEGTEDITGGATSEMFLADIMDLDDLWENQLRKVNREFLFGVSAEHTNHGYGVRNGIEENHAYIVMDARTLKTGERLLKLRYVNAPKLSH